MNPAVAAKAATVQTPVESPEGGTLWFLRRVVPQSGLYVAARLVNGKFHNQICDSIEELAQRVLMYDAQAVASYYGCASYREREVESKRPDGTTWKQVRIQRNVRQVQDFWADLDVGADNPAKYESQEAALDGLVAFCRATGLPIPMVISSGYGAHVHWRLANAITPESWKPTAESLKLLAAKLGFKADPACSADMARVLRPVGTWNRKDPNNPRPVELVADAEAIDPAEFQRLVADALTLHQITAPVVIRPGDGAGAAINQDFAVKQNFPPCSGIKVAERCQQLAVMRDTRGDMPEPAWFACIQLLCHSTEGEELIHQWSNGYAGYTAAETNRKIGQIRGQDIGPTLCATFESRSPGGCDGCPFKGKISSPAQLGGLHVVHMPPAAGAQSNGTNSAITTGSELGGTAPIVQPAIAFSFTEPVPTAQAIVQSQYTIGGHRTLHCWQGEFYAWTGSHYTLLPIADVREMLYRVGSESSRSVKRQHVDNALDALRARANLSNTIPSPSWIAAEKNDPPARSLIPMINGILNVETHTLLPKTPRFFSSYSLPFDYNPEAPSPTDWLEFLNQLWGEDTESIELVQEWFGYCLTQRTEQQKALLFVGPKRGGKGTIGRVLTALLGPANVVSPRLASFGKEFGLESLIGKQLALVSDARLGPKSDLDAVAENVLRVTGEDQISIPRKFRDDFTATLPTRIMVLTNEPPRFTDGSGALPSRFVVLQSEASFFGREDHTLTQRLLTNLPGIFNWSLGGLNRLNDRGYFRQPAASNELVEQIELLAAPVKAFLAEKCETSDPVAEVPIADLFAAWRVWCALNGREHPGTQQSFGRDLHSALPWGKTVQHRVGGERIRCFVGIRLKK